MATAVRNASVPKVAQSTFEEVTRLTDTFCNQWLTEEYAQLCRELAAALCRKRPSPLTRGGLAGWAAGIVSSIGSVNFLHDPTQKPHMRLSDIGPRFGVSAGTAAAKAKQIRDIFKMTPMDPQWCLPSQLDKNPLAWLIEVNGIVIDARHAPLGIQREAFRLGYIPHMP